VTVPEGLWQQLVVELPHVLLHADRVVQARQVEAMIIIGKIVESEISIKQRSQIKKINIDKIN
jgi:hypothetical protein